MNQDFKDYFSPVASNYSLYRPEYPDALFDFLETFTPKDATVWDCACGSGQATVLLAKHFKKVIASDASETQLKHALQRSNIEYHLWTAEKTDLPSQTIDLITVAQALHWFATAKFYTEASRVLKKTGYIAAWCYKLCKVNEAIDKLILDLHNNKLGPFWPKERWYIDRDYSNLNFPFKKLKTPHFYMTANWRLNQMLGYLSSWSATGRYMQAKGKSPIDEFAPKLKEFWDQDEIKLVSWKVILIVGKAE